MVVNSDMKKIAVIFCTMFLIISGYCINVSATPTDSFVHTDSIGGETTAVAAREMYSVSKVITAATLGIEESIQGITDICCANDGTVYVLCGDNSRLIVLNKDYTFNREFTIYKDNVEVNFTGAQGVFVDKKNNVYIADSQNARVLVCDQDGVVKDEWNKPESDLIPEDFVYTPVSVSRDEKGYSYVLSLGSFYGALAYNPKGEFMGFYGANKVKGTALDAIKTIWEKLTKNDDKRAASIKSMPYSFIDLTLDNQGYMITCTGQIEEKTGVGQIRKISPDGQDILYKSTTSGKSVSSSSVNFLESKMNPRQGEQNFCSIAVDDDGFLYALEDRYGLIYVYDKECNLVCGFGGGMQNGIQQGTFHTPVAIAVNNLSVIVADQYNCSITVFNISEYGKLLRQAHILYNKGDYTEAEASWKEVLANDRGNQAAYRGLAMASYSRGDYDEAMNYAKSGMDYTVYDLAKQEKTKESVANSFILIIICAVILIGLIIFIMVYFKKKNKKLVINEKVKTMLSVTFHPFQSFDEVRYKNKGSLIGAVVLLVLLYIGFALKATATGFLFLESSPKNFNVFLKLAQTVGLVLLWTISNWLVCSMFSGKGKLKDIFIATVYSLIPLIVYTFLSVVLSHVLPLSGAEFLSTFQTIIWIYTFFLLSIAMMTVHEYDFFKFLLTGIGVVFLMLMIVFILFMFYMLFGQVVDFVSSLYDEVACR